MQDQNRLDDDNTSPEDVGEELLPPRSAGGVYEIRVKGHLNDTWSNWLEGLEMERMDNGEMILFGSIVDQAALLGVLNKLSHMNLILLSVNQGNRKINKEKK
jgi:hypothetical protein